MDTWKDMNPSFEYMEWNDDNLKNRRFYNKRQIDDMESYNGKCNIMRYEILFKYGGFFIDADSECIAPLDDYLFDVPRFTCYENEIKGITNGVKLLSSGYMASEKGDGFMELCIREIHEKDLKGKLSHHTIGNLFLANMVAKYPEFPMTIYPSYFFIPKHGTGETYTGEGKVYAKQYWGSTFGIYDKL